MRRDRFSFALAFAALLGLVWIQGSGCRKKSLPVYKPGPGKPPTIAPYKPPPSRVPPTLRPGVTPIYPTLRPGQTLRPTLPR